MSKFNEDNKNRAKDRRIRFLNMHNNGMSYKDIAKKEGISRAQAYNLVRIAKYEVTKPEGERITP